MPKFARPTAYNGRQGNQAKTGSVRFANATEAAAGEAEDLAISPATLDSAVTSLIPDASTTQKGIIEIATDAEALAGTSTTLAMTPHTVGLIAIAGAPDASTTVKGIIEIATDAEAAAQTSGSLALVPSNLPSIMAEPGAIGGTTAAAGAFTTLSSSGLSTLDSLAVTNASQFSGNVTIDDGINVILDTTTGTKIGTATSQKIGFLNATPVAQQANTTDLKDVLVNFGFLASGGATPLNLDGGDLTCNDLTINDLSVNTVTFGDGENIVFQTTTGSQIGTATNQKLAFYGSTPVVQAANTSDLKDVLTDLGLVASGGATPLDLDGGAATLGATTLEGNLTIQDGLNVVLDTTSGTKFGTSTSQKLAFFNSTPVAQQANTTDLKDLLVTFGFLATGGATPLDLDQGTLTTGQINIEDGFNVVLDTTTGTKFGTATTQKLAFYNATPVAQQVNTTDLKDMLVTLGLIASGGATPLDLDQGTLTTGEINIEDGFNVVLDTTTGTKFGTATTQKLAFYNSTPVAQQANTTDIKDCLTTLGLLASGGATPLNLDGGDLTCDQIVSSDLTVATVTIATGDVLTLAGTPVELVAAPGSGKFLELVSAQLILDYNSVPYTESGDNLVIRYTNGSGAILSQAIETTGFIDQSADTQTNALPKIDAIVASASADNAPLVLHNTGSNFAAGNSSVIVKIAYRIHTSGL